MINNKDFRLAIIKGDVIHENLSCDVVAIQKYFLGIA
jgi:hypothetical protein